MEVDRHDGVCMSDSDTDGAEENGDTDPEVQDTRADDDETDSRDSES